MLRKKKKSTKKNSLFQSPHLKDSRRRESLPKEFSIQHRIPTIGSTPVEYRIPPMLLYLFHNIEDMAEATLSELQNADQYNECYFDQTIDSTGLLADNHLKEQKRSHERAILSIEQELRASLLEKQNYRAMLQEIYDKNEEEIEEYEKSKKE